MKETSESPVVITKKVVVLFSGGLDSTYMLLRLVKEAEEIVPSIVPYSQHYSLTKPELIRFELEIYPVFFNYGQRFCVQEEACMRKTLEAIFAYNMIRQTGTVNPRVVVSISSPIYGELPILRSAITEHHVVTKSTKTKHWAYVPARNALLILTAYALTAQYEPDYIWVGAAKEDGDNKFPDCTGEFLENINKIIHLYSDGKTSVHFPLQRCSEYMFGDEMGDSDKIPPKVDPVHETKEYRKNYCKELLLEGRGQYIFSGYGEITEERSS